MYANTYRCYQSYCTLKCCSIKIKQLLALNQWPFKEVSEIWAHHHANLQLRRSWRKSYLSGSLSGRSDTWLKTIFYDTKCHICNHRTKSLERRYHRSVHCPSVSGQEAATLYCYEIKVCIAFCFKIIVLTVCFKCCYSKSIYKQSSASRRCRSIYKSTILTLQLSDCSFPV